MPLALSLARNHLGISAVLACDSKDGKIGILAQYDGPPSFNALRESVRAWGDLPRIATLPFHLTRGPFGPRYGSYGLVITDDLAEAAYNSPLSEPKPFNLLPLTIEKFNDHARRFDRLERQGEIEVIPRKDYPHAINTFAQCLADSRLMGVKGEDLVKRLQEINITQDDVLTVKDTGVMAAAIAVSVLTSRMGFQLSEAEARQFDKSLATMTSALASVVGDAEVNTFKDLTGSDLMEVFER